MRSATASATAVFPEAVGPKVARTLVTEPRSGALEVVVAQARVAQEALDVPMATLELLEDAGHRCGGSLGDPLEALEVLVALGRGEPLLVPRAQSLLAECV